MGEWKQKAQEQRDLAAAREKERQRNLSERKKGKKGRKEPPYKRLTKTMAKT